MNHFNSCTNAVSADLPMVTMAMSSLNTCAKIFASSRSQYKGFISKNKQKIEDYSLRMRHLFSINFLRNFMWVDSILFFVSPVFSCVEHRTQSDFSMGFCFCFITTVLNAMQVMSLQHRDGTKTDTVIHDHCDSTTVSLL